MSITILDCTLRDGGYVNEWNFSEKSIKKMIPLLINSNLDYLECGFLKNTPYEADKTLFNEISQIEELLPANFHKTKIVLMIVCGKYDTKTIANNSKTHFTIRITFKKNEIPQVLEEAKFLMSKGYDVFLNPTQTITYSDLELLDLISKINELKPYGMAIVDTTGTMRNKDVSRLFHLIDHNLNEEIALCFHSHNNLQLSFSNAQELIKLNPKRELIIDSCVFGMGRGAGNLPTELILTYLNENYNAKYNLIPILKIIDEHIGKIFAKTPWGYSVPYYLAASHNCHPNYASFLVEKQTVSIEIINSILEHIPQEKKSNFDKDFIEKTYIDYQSHYIDDTKEVANLKTTLSSKTLLVLASGKTLESHKEEIHNFISQNEIYIISLNFLPKEFSVNNIFATNLKRFTELENMQNNFILTSNIQTSVKNCIKINYSNYLSNSLFSDNAVLMFLKLAETIDIKNIVFAGLDGFSENPLVNYYDNELINSGRIKDYKVKNTTIKEEIKKFTKKIKINFLTPSLYQ